MVLTVSDVILHQQFCLITGCRLPLYLFFIKLQIWEGKWGNIWYFTGLYFINLGIQEANIKILKSGRFTRLSRKIFENVCIWINKPHLEKVASLREYHCFSGGPTDQILDLFGPVWCRRKTVYSVKNLRKQVWTGNQAHTSAKTTDWRTRNSLVQCKGR